MTDLRALHLFLKLPPTVSEVAAYLVRADRSILQGSAKTPSGDLS